MDTALNADLLADLCQAVGLPLSRRERIRAWSMSGVERLAFPDGTTTVYKYAIEPFTREDQVWSSTGWPTTTSSSRTR